MDCVCHITHSGAIIRYRRRAPGATWPKDLWEQTEALHSHPTALRRRGMQCRGSRAEPVAADVAPQHSLRSSASSDSAPEKAVVPGSEIQPGSADQVSSRQQQSQQESATVCALATSAGASTSFAERTLPDVSPSPEIDPKSSVTPDRKTLSLPLPPQAYAQATAGPSVPSAAHRQQASARAALQIEERALKKQISAEDCCVGEGRDDEGCSDFPQRPPK